MSSFAKSYLAPQSVTAEAFSRAHVPRKRQRSEPRATFPLYNRALMHQLSRRLGSLATFVFEAKSAPSVCFDTYGGANLMHNQIVYNQTRSLCLHVEALDSALLITNIYAHPLIQKNEIFVGHRVVAFVGLPIRDIDQKMIGAVCSVDIKERRWDSKDLRALKKITAQIEGDWLRQNYESVTRAENTE